MSEARCLLDRIGERYGSYFLSFDSDGLFDYIIIWAVLVQMYGIPLLEDFFASLLKPDRFAGLNSENQFAIILLVDGEQRSWRTIDIYAEGHFWLNCHDADVL